MPDEVESLEDRRRNRRTLILLWGSLFVVWFDWQAFIAVVPSFEDVFANFKYKLPWPTSLAIQISHGVQWFRGISTLVWLVPLYFLIVFPFQGLRLYGRKTAIWIFAVSGLVAGFILWAIFVPMFEINAVK